MLSKEQVTVLKAKLNDSVKELRAKRAKLKESTARTAPKQVETLTRRIDVMNIKLQTIKQLGL